MSLIEKIDKLDRRIIFLLLLILCFIPVIVPLGLPIPNSPATISAYNAMVVLKPKDIICITFDYAGGSAAELYPQNVVLLKHARKLDLRVVAVSFTVGGSELADMAFSEAGWGAKKYGTDYVNLGFISGSETGMSSYVKDIPATVAADFKRTPIGQIPLMSEVKNINSFKYLAFTTSTSQDMYVRQFSNKGTPIIGCIQSLYFSVMQVYIGSGQIVGFLNGLRGSAEYERMINELGAGVISMDQASVTHWYGVILLIIGNITFFMTRRTPKSKGGTSIG
jgi:hypothetical protein